MSWQCPVCQNSIRHSELDQSPRLGVSYRCHICRLELTVDPSTHDLTVTLISRDETGERQRSTT
jgi:hypothetical protein